MFRDEDIPRMWDRVKEEKRRRLNMTSLLAVKAQDEKNGYTVGALA